MDEPENIAVTNDAEQRDGSKLGVERLVMRLLIVCAVAIGVCVFFMDAITMLLLICCCGESVRDPYDDLSA